MSRMSGNLHLFDIAAILVVVAVAFGVLNHHLLRLPFTIGLTASGLVASVVMAVVDTSRPASASAPPCGGS
jgi:hypothetical protein